MSPAMTAVAGFLNERKNQRYEAADIARATGYSVRTVQRSLRSLQGMGVVHRMPAIYSPALGWYVKDPSWI